MELIRAQDVEARLDEVLSGPDAAAPASV